jgi:uncharacterized protein YndB with AHSA1/START domain
MTAMAQNPPPDDTAFATSITLHAPIDRAFRVFTAGFDSWWPREHHIGAAEMAEAVLELHHDGRWFERGVDGSECDWGRVLAYEPPNHIALSWHLDGSWTYDPDPAKASRVDVRFVAETEHVTRVELRHSGLDHHGSDWLDLRAGIAGPGGWNGLLGRFAAKAKA